MFRFSQIFLCIVLTIFVPSAAYANAHCWCRLGPTGSPYKDFGAIATFSGQSGHDNYCSGLCQGKASQYMASNQAAVCQAANYGTVVASSCVGTHPWQTAWTQTCPSGNNPAPGGLNFDSITAHPGAIQKVEINGSNVGINANTQSSTIIPATPKFTKFVFTNPINFHAQSWTYTVKLYRDNQLVETLSGKSPAVSQTIAVATFTEQPNNFVHGHGWKIDWAYAGPNQANGTTSYAVQ